jgi:predicted P-loop ATPase
MTNALMVLRQHPKTMGNIKYNQFKQEIEYNNRPFEENDLLDLVYLLQGDVKLSNISRESVYAAVQKYANENKYDEAKDWLDSIVWDKCPRLEKWLISATGVDDDRDGYHRAIGMQWFCGLVKRLANVSQFANNHGHLHFHYA